MDNKTPQHTARDKAWQLWLKLIWGIFAGCLMFLFLLLFGDDFLALGQNMLHKVKVRTRSKVEIPKSAIKTKVIDGIHTETGLAYGPGFEAVRTACLSCHSSKLIIQNRANRDGWKSMIRWMQETQGLPDLGRKEKVILDYLAKYYAPQETGRRPNLPIDEIEWYVLELK